MNARHKPKCLVIITGIIHTKACLIPPAPLLGSEGKHALFDRERRGTAASDHEEGIQAGEAQVPCKESRQVRRRCLVMRWRVDGLGLGWCLVMRWRVDDDGVVQETFFLKGTMARVRVRVGLGLRLGLGSAAGLVLGSRMKG